MARSGRAGGRKSRVAERTAPVAAINPCPPGQTGGQYRPLNDADRDRIIDTAYKILAEIGMGDVPQEFEELALQKGAALNHLGRLTFSRDLMEDIVRGWRDTKRKRSFPFEIEKRGRSPTIE